MPGIGAKSPRTALPNTHQPAQTLCDEAQPQPNRAKPSQTVACTASGYRADCPKRAFEFSVVRCKRVDLLPEALDEKAFHQRHMTRGNFDSASYPSVAVCEAGGLQGQWLTPGPFVRVVCTRLKHGCCVVAKWSYCFTQPD